MRTVPDTLESSVALPGFAREAGPAQPVRRAARRLRWATLAAVAIAVTAAILVWPRLAPPPDDVLRASGRIEGREVTVAAKVIQGRIARLLADEGDTVARGALLAELEATQLDAQVDAAEAAVAAFDAQVQQAALEVGYTTKNSDAAIAAAQAALGAARAQVARGTALLANVGANADRARALAEAGAISTQEREVADTLLQTTRAELSAAEDAVAHAQANLAMAQASRDAIVLKRQQLRALEHSRRTGAARLREASATRDERLIVAPQRGTIVSRPVEVGDVVSPGSPIFRLVDLSRLYLKIYLPERELAKLRLGDRAEVFVDAFPDRPFAARVSKVHEQAEFTPKNVETPEERLKLVFGVELTITNGDGVLKPGMPADGVVHWTGAGPGRRRDGS